MTRIELLRIVIGRARANGFEFRRWYVSRLGLPWISTDAALTALDAQRRYYALLFNHEFARSFWKPGEEITFTIAASSFDRIMPDGSVAQVNRKPYIRRSARRDAWRYHLQQMALAEEPLRYVRKYMHVADDVEEDTLPELSSLEGHPLEEDLMATGTGHSSAPKLSVVPSREPASLDATVKSRKPVHTAPKLQSAHIKTASRGGRSKPMDRPLPTDLPAFLRRPPHSR
ncbi:hypothetical protein SAMN05421819_1008 [Bryocella elongata]|uniref:Uncharacterized protein n=1 Tax=Bryocella elongata TaxID=863522 RepID=A0A1H5UHQ5_9BACT|nr:hypothetical protein [Bryocella elongata]SEF73921.1 hypothetical protein SAMN05421819_1008 [Bryocella elongata]